MNITLRELIEVYEEKLRGVEAALDSMKRDKDHQNTLYQEARAEFIKAIEDIKACKSPKHRDYAGQFGDSYPYRKQAVKQRWAMLKTDD